MSSTNRIGSRLIATLATASATFVLAGPAGAIDLRDWGRKFAASERFVVLAEFNNQAVLDKETQLVWQRTPLQQGRDFGTARLDCANGYFGGRRGWRLPTVHELSTLADPQAASGALALPAGHPFQSAQASTYWTMTRYVFADGSLTSTSYYVDFANRGVNSVSSWLNARLSWCVRGAGPTNRY